MSVIEHQESSPLDRETRSLLLGPGFGSDKSCNGSNAAAAAAAGTARGAGGSKPPATVVPGSPG